MSSWAGTRTRPSRGCSKRVRIWWNGRWWRRRRRDFSAARAMMRIAVVDYGSGNLASASRALAVAAERAEIPASVIVTADPDAVFSADRIVLPGQGAFADCARGLRAVPGMWQAIERATHA